MTIQRDEDLISEIQEGNIVAFETLIKRYQNRLYHVAFRMIKNEHDAKDVVQMVFIHLYQTIDRIDARRRFSSYAFTMVRNETISFIRGKKLHVPLESLNLPADSDPDLEQLIRQGKQKEVQDAVLNLRAGYRQVITLYYFEDLSYEEIGKKLRMPINTVRTHLRRAKAVLKKILYEN